MVIMKSDNAIVNMAQFSALEVMECDKSTDVNGFLAYIHLASGSKILMKHTWKTIEEARFALEVIKLELEKG